MVGRASLPLGRSPAAAQPNAARTGLNNSSTAAAMANKNALNTTTVRVCFCNYNVLPFVVKFWLTGSGQGEKEMVEDNTMIGYKFEAIINYCFVY